MRVLLATAAEHARSEAAGHSAQPTSAGLLLRLRGVLVIWRGLGLRVSTAYGSARVRAGTITRRSFPSCVSRGGLDEIVALALGIPLGNPVDELDSGWIKRSDLFYHPIGSGGGATVGPPEFGEPLGFGGVGWLIVDVLRWSLE